MTAVSVVVPAYKEPGLADFHRRLVEQLNYWWSWDLVYSVGDQATMRIALGCMTESLFRNRGWPRAVRIRMQEGRGLGQGVRQGYAAALMSNPDYVVTMEADGSNDPADIKRLVAECEPICGIPLRGSVIASRRLDCRPLRKRFLSRCYKSALRLRYGLGFDDEGYGDYTHLFRCAPAPVVRAVLPGLRYPGYEGVAEFHVRARQAGYPFVLELPTDYHRREAGESKLTARKMLAMARLLVS